MARPQLLVSSSTSSEPQKIAAALPKLHHATLCILLFGVWMLQEESYIKPRFWTEAVIGMVIIRNAMLDRAPHITL